MLYKEGHPQLTTQPRRNHETFSAETESSQNVVRQYSADNETCKQFKLLYSAPKLKPKLNFDPSLAQIFQIPDTIEQLLFNFIWKQSNYSKLLDYLFKCRPDTSKQ